MRSVFYLISIALMFFGVRLFYNIPINLTLYKYSFVFCLLFIFPYARSYYESDVLDKNIMARYVLWSSVSVLIYMAIVFFDYSIAFLYRWVLRNWAKGVGLLVLSCILFYSSSIDCDIYKNKDEDTIFNRSKNIIEVFLICVFLIFHFQGFVLLFDKMLVSLLGVIITGVLGCAILFGLLKEY